MKRLILIVGLLFLFGATTQAQDKPVCPKSLICITQEAANAAAANVRELKAKDEKITVLEEAVDNEKKNTQAVRDTAAKNESDLRIQLHSTEVSLAEKTGQLIQMEADRVRWMAVVDVLIKNSREKRIGLINLF